MEEIVDRGRFLRIELSTSRIDRASGFLDLAHKYPGQESGQKHVGLWDGRVVRVASRPNRLRILQVYRLFRACG